MELKEAERFLGLNGFDPERMVRIQLLSKKYSSLAVGELTIVLQHEKTGSPTDNEATGYEFGVVLDQTPYGLASIVVSPDKNHTVSELLYQDYDPLAGNWGSSKEVEFFPIEAGFLRGVVDSLMSLLVSGRFLLSVKEDDIEISHTWVKS